MCDIFGFIHEVFVVGPVSLRGNINTYFYPVVPGIVLHSEGFKIMIRSPVLSLDCVDKGVTRRFETREDVL